MSSRLVRDAHDHPIAVLVTASSDAGLHTGQMFKIVRDEPEVTNTAVGWKGARDRLGRRPPSPRLPGSR